MNAACAIGFAKQAMDMNDTLLDGRSAKEELRKGTIRPSSRGEAALTGGALGVGMGVLMSPLTGTIGALAGGRGQRLRGAATVAAGGIIGGGVGTALLGALSPKGYYREVKKTASKLSIGLGSLGTALGAAGLVQGQRTRKDVGVMREQSRAADTLHSAMLFEGRTGSRLRPDVRQAIGTRFQTANKGYSERFGPAKR